MATWPGLVLSATLLALPTTISYAGPCASDIDRLQARVDAVLTRKAAAGPTAPESPAALMSRQPTPGSIAAAEAAIGDLSPAAAETITQGMTRARAADAAGDATACARALAEVGRAIGR
ncbi:MAG: hypothetical protein IT537_27995 [Hyphomicrobiales bacterium]|nr:hypothetical protein [Hyphomicrobiales bacterium]